MVEISRYHKGFANSNTYKVIHRYQPIQIGELFIYYIWLVVSAVNQLKIYLDSKSSSSNSLATTRTHHDYNGGLAVTTTTDITTTTVIPRPKPLNQRVVKQIVRRDPLERRAVWQFTG